MNEKFGGTGQLAVNPASQSVGLFATPCNPVLPVGTLDLDVPLMAEPVLAVYPSRTFMLA
jgi:hypothetical protein